MKAVKHKFKKISRCAREACKHWAKPTFGVVFGCKSSHVNFYKKIDAVKNVVYNSRAGARKWVLREAQEGGLRWAKAAERRSGARSWRKFPPRLRWRGTKAKLG